MIGVVDSSVCISALIRGGVPLQALERVQVYHQMATCHELNAEIRRKLITKFAWAPALASIAVDRLFASALAVTPTGALAGSCRDPRDDFILECAVLANADFILSSDKDLLVLDPFRGVRILQPRAFIDRLEK